jgi:hypothetical protein
VLVKATLAEVPPVFQAAVRFAGATLLLWIWCRMRGVALFTRDGSLGAGLLAGALFAGEFACIYLGLQHTSASRLTVFLYTSPFWVAALLPLFVKTERLRPVQWAGLACAFAAVAFALREGFPRRRRRASPGPVTCSGLAAGALWGLTTVTIRSTTLARVSAEKMLYYQVAVSTIVLPLLSAGLGRALGFRIQRLRRGLAADADRGRRVRELPGVDVDAGALPGHEDFGVRVPHADLRAAVRRAVVEGAGHAQPAGRAGAGGRRHRAGEPQAGLSGRAAQ